MSNDAYQNLDAATQAAMQDKLDAPPLSLKELEKYERMWALENNITNEKYFQGVPRDAYPQ